MRPLTAFAAGAASGVLASRLVHALRPKPMTTFHAPDGVAAPGSRAFELELGALSHSDATEGNDVQVMDGKDEYIREFFHALRRAQDSIWFEVFWWRDGRFAEEAVDALSEALARGVDVRLVVDGYGAHNAHMKSLHRVQAAGADLQVLYPVALHQLRRFNNSTHRRVLIVDGRSAYTGGVGIDDRWLGEGGDPPWADLLVRLEGPAVQHLAGVFADHWRLATGDPLAGAAALQEQEKRGRSWVQVFHGGPDSGATGLRLAILYALSAAQDSLRLVTPYFVPDALIVERLVDAQERGVDVELILPSDKTDRPFVRRASRTRWGPLLRAGVTIQEFQPTQVHTKAILLDDVWCLLGSMNVDERSLRHNAEVGIGTTDEAAVQKLRRCIDGYREQSVAIGLGAWRHRPVAQRAGDQASSLMAAQL